MYKESEVKERIVQYIMQSLTDEVDVVRCSAAKALGKLMAGEGVDLLIERLVDEDPDVRHDAAWALARLCDSRAVKPLIKLLEDDDPVVVGCAIESIARIKGNDVRDAVEPLIESLTTEKEFFYEDTGYTANVNAEVQEKAALALGEIGDLRAVSPLLDIVNDYSTYDVMQASFVALLKIGDEKGVKRVEEALSDPDHRIRRRALRAMIRSGYPDLVEKLIYVLIDEDGEIKLIAMDALANMGHSGEATVPLVLLLKDDNEEVCLKAIGTVEKILGGKAATHLVPLLKHRRDSVRSRAVEALGNIGTEEAVEPLRDLLQVEKVDKVIEEAITSLGKIGGKDALQCLLEFLRGQQDKAENDFLRKRLVGTIGSFKSKDSLNALIDVLKGRDEPELTRQISAERLQGFEGEELVPLLRSAIEEEKKEEEVRDQEIRDEGEKGESPPVRFWAARALRGNRSRDSEKFLLDLLEDDNLQVKREAAIALASIGNEAAIDVLFPEEVDENSKIDVDLLESIAGISGERADEILMLCLKNQDPGVRYYTLRAVSCKDSGGKVLPAVLDLLKDENEVVRQEAVVALGDMKISTAIEPLVALLFSMDAANHLLSDEMIRALRKIDSNETAKMILDRLSDCKDWSIKTRAIDALSEICPHSVLQGM